MNRQATHGCALASKCAHTPARTHMHDNRSSFAAGQRRTARDLQGAALELAAFALRSRHHAIIGKPCLNFAQTKQGTLSVSRNLSMHTNTRNFKCSGNRLITMLPCIFFLCFFFLLKLKYPLAPPQKRKCPCLWCSHICHLRPESSHSFFPSLKAVQNSWLGGAW